MFNLLLPNVMDLTTLIVLESPIQTLKKEVKEVEPKTTKKIHKVRKNDNLSKIAKKYNTTWQRIFYKNKQLKDPNKLVVGQVLQIPRKYERLKKRSYYIPVIRSAPRINDNIVQSYVQENTIGDVSEGHGNFEWGWCTWFAQSQRPDRKFSGNAGDWIVYANSSSPSVGAVAVTVGGLGHVAIVRQVDGDRVFVEEMNYRGFGVVSSRWTTTAEFQGYIL